MNICIWIKYIILLEMHCNFLCVIYLKYTTYSGYRPLNLNIFIIIVSCNITLLFISWICDFLTELKYVTFILCLSISFLHWAEIKHYYTLLEYVIYILAWIHSFFYKNVSIRTVYDRFLANLKNVGMMRFLPKRSYSAKVPNKNVWTSTCKTKNEVNNFSFKLPICIAESGGNSTFKQ